jgi:hypothetical protein
LPETEIVFASSGYTLRAVQMNAHNMARSGHSRVSSSAEPYGNAPLTPMTFKEEKISRLGDQKRFPLD